MLYQPEKELCSYDTNSVHAEGWVAGLVGDVSRGGCVCVVGGGG